MKDFSVYVHIPFCTARCRYCNFYSGENHTLIPSYPALILAEAEARKGEYGNRGAFSLYLGGGTPSLLGPKGINAIVTGIKEKIGLLPDAEITVEVNPSSAPRFAQLKSSGVNRLSLGVEALTDRNLILLGRPHTSKEALDSIKEAEGEGFSVSADLLYGYEGLGNEELLQAAESLIEAGVEHLSAYSLELKGRGENFPELRNLPPEEEEEQAARLASFLEEKGLAQYEVSNFASPGRMSRHNLGYWTGKGYMGLGPGAHGFNPALAPFGERRWNLENLAEYARALNEGRPPPHETERPGKSEALLERLFLTLRMKMPFDPASITQDPDISPLIARLVTSGDLAALPGNLFIPTSRGLKRADGLASWLHGRLAP